MADHDARYRAALAGLVGELGVDGAGEFIAWFRRQAIAAGEDPALVAEVTADLEAYLDPEAAR